MEAIAQVPKRVTMTADRTASPDGIRVVEYQAGETYRVPQQMPVEVALSFLRTRDAEEPASRGSTPSEPPASTGPTLSVTATEPANGVQSFHATGAGSQVFVRLVGLAGTMAGAALQERVTHAVGAAVAVSLPAAGAGAVTFAAVGPSGEPETETFIVAAVTPPVAANEMPPAPAAPGADAPPAAEPETPKPAEGDGASQEAGGDGKEGNTEAEARPAAKPRPGSKPKPAGEAPAGNGGGAGQ